MSIYVLRSDNLVKIGFSDNLRHRVQSIIAATPVAVEFVGHMPGGKDVEKHLHEIFSASNFSGEWFVETDEMRRLFDVLLVPRLPRPQTAKQIKRSAEKTSTKMLSARVRSAAAWRWPNKRKTEIVTELAAVLGWSSTRTKDFYYANPRLSLRAFELKEVEEWLENRREPAFAIAPELRDEE